MEWHHESQDLQNYQSGKTNLKPWPWRYARDQRPCVDSELKPRPYPSDQQVHPPYAIHLTFCQHRQVKWNTMRITYNDLQLQFIIGVSLIVQNSLHRNRPREAEIMTPDINEETFRDRPRAHKVLIRLPNINAPRFDCTPLTSFTNVLKTDIT